MVENGHARPQENLNKIHNPHPGWKRKLKFQFFAVFSKMTCFFLQKVLFNIADSKVNSPQKRSSSICFYLYNVLQCYEIVK